MTQDEKDELTAGLASKADKIRALHAHGVSHREIADYLGVKPQYVDTIVREYPAGRKRVPPNRLPTASELAAVLAPPAGLSPHAAKLGLAAFLGVPTAAIEIIIRCKVACARRAAASAAKSKSDSPKADPIFVRYGGKADSSVFRRPTPLGFLRSFPLNLYRLTGDKP